MQNQFLISVLQRGDITQRILATWETQLPKKVKNKAVTVTSKYSDDADIIIIPTNCTEEAVKNWAGKVPPKEKLANPNFAVETLKYGDVVDPSMFKPVFSEQIEKSSPTPPSSSAAKATASPNAYATTPPAPATDVNRGLSPRKTANENVQITQVLDSLQKVYESSGDKWRALVYKKASAQLKTLPKITCVEQLQGLQGFGKSITDKVEEILQSGSLQKLQHFQDDPKIRAMQEFWGIWGVGDKTAEMLVSKGLYTVADVRERGTHLLNAQQKIGLKYYEEFLEKMPRSEVEEIHATVVHHANQLIPGVECVLCGSYRRGKEAIGDADMIIAPPPGVASFSDAFIIELIDSLESAGFLTDHLALPIGYEDHLAWKYKRKTGSIMQFVERTGTQQRGAQVHSDIANAHLVESDGEESASSTDTKDSSKPPPIKKAKKDKPFFYKQHSQGSYMGVCKLPHSGAKHRRIDIKVYKRDQLPFAVFYFTGPDHFERSIRKYANKLGYHLNDKNMEKCVANVGKGDRVGTGEFVHCTTEQDIFAALGLQYKEPHDREVFVDPEQLKK